MSRAVPITSGAASRLISASSWANVAAEALERLWTRAAYFRRTPVSPVLLTLIALGGGLEKALTAATIWVALVGTGTTVARLPIIVVVPLPQTANVVPIPASLGAYDVLLAEESPY